MPFLQLIERAEGSSFELDVVDLPVGKPSRPPAGTLPMSAGSRELLGLASLVSVFGLRPLGVEIEDPSGRSTGEFGNELETELLRYVRDNDPDRATRVLAQTPNFLVEKVTLEDPETRAVVTLSRRGVISVQGPAVQQQEALVSALLRGLERAFDR